MRWPPIRAHPATREKQQEALMGRRVILRCCFFFWAATVSAVSEALPNCKAECGGVNISYPFGIGDGCYRAGFDITCNTTFTPTKPFLGKGNLEVLEILSDTGLLRINQFVARNCYESQDNGRTWIDVNNRPYKFSSTRNKFVAIGCDTQGYLIEGFPQWASNTPVAPARFSTGCASLCNNVSLVEDGICSGIGCCETPVPKGLDVFNIFLQSFYNHTYCWGFDPCSYAFLADINSFTFSTTNFSDLRNVSVYPVTLEWAIGNKKCDQSRHDGDYACVDAHSYCYNATDVAGYRCNCSAGFTGNPYINGGCHDINECSVIIGACISECHNTLGNYTCTCPQGMMGDGRRDGYGCQCIPGFEDDGSSGCKAMPKFPLLTIVLAAGSSVMFLIASTSWIYLVLKKRKLLELKKKLFQQNGGLLLLQQISSLEGVSSDMKIFSSEELKKATNNYSEDRILGKGGFGTVYKGILSDQTVVAVKKSKISDEGQVEQFINEVVILSRIGHESIVKLLGCCLETQVPMLVYEFVSNGTLSQHIHDEGFKGSLSLENRMRIVAEIAGALYYLHSSASIPIIHRDIKSSNILLDDNYKAKVCDFGISRLVPFDKNCLTTLVRGTFGYLDPEYFYSGQFTDKSDVYSFGVVLVELLTGKKAISENTTQGNGSLASYFISCISGDKLLHILEDRILDEGSKEHLVAISELAKRCLQLKGEERPTMKEVVEELEELAFSKHPWIEKNHEENEPFLSII